MGKSLVFSSPPPGKHIFTSLRKNLLPKDWNRLMQTYSKPCQFTNFDTIQMTASDCKNLNDSLPLAQFPLSELFARPALNIFTIMLKVDESNLFYLHFRPTALPETTPIQKKSGDIVQFHPKVDMYMSPPNGNHADYIFAIGCDRGLDDLETILTIPLWCRKMYQDETPIKLTNISNLYPLLQVAIRERPTIFLEEKQSEIIIPTTPRKKTSKTSQKSNPNKVKLVRNIRIDATKISKGTHIITCPSWGVIGHYRQYKSGKKVWIAPYKKGRERHNAASYQPKEYQLQPSTEDTTVE